MAATDSRVKRRSQRDGPGDIVRDGWTGMIRFLVGVGCGAALMYWLLTGDLPWSEEGLRWLSDNASSYSGSLRK
jgi:hypothetical protein